MVEPKANDHNRPLEVPEAKPLASSDADVIVNPSAQDKQLAEVDRTNKSSGSLTELSFRSQGLTREQVAARMKEQEESVSIDNGDGRDASRKSGLTERDLLSVGRNGFDAKTGLAYDNQSSSSIISDGTNERALSENQDKITLKPVEVASRLIKTGLDYNQENLSFTQKLANFTQSAQTRFLDSADRQAYFQGIIDKALGVGEGLNQAKDEIKDSAKVVASKAWIALNDGSVASFMAKPNAINEPLFKTIGGCFDAMSRDPNVTNNVLTIMGREFEEANNKYSVMTPHERGVQDGRAMFFFINPSGSTEGGELVLKVADDVATHVDAAVMKAMPQAMKTAEEAAVVSMELASDARQILCDYLPSKGLTSAELEYAEVPKDYLVGKGGDWPVLNERPSPEVVQQIGSQSCVAAVGEMLSERAFVQADLIETVGTIPEGLLSVLGPDWRGGFILEETREKALDIFLRSGKPWGAELRDEFYHRIEMGHMVVVDGLDEAGNLMIRDPQHATKYEMTRETFLKYWSDRALYRIKIK